jgi:hypothetical protein
MRNSPFPRHSMLIVLAPFLLWILLISAAIFVTFKALDEVQHKGLKNIASELWNGDATPTPTPK